MNIAFFHELHRGGARRSANEFAKYLKRNHEVDLYIVDGKRNDNEKKFYSRIFFYKFIPEKWTGKNWTVRLYKDTVELYNLYKLHQKIAKEIDKKKYELVFLEPSRFTQAPFILRFLKTKKIYYCQEPLRLVYDSKIAIEKNLNFLKALYERLIRKARKTIDKANIKCADLVIANSKYTRKNIETAYGIKNTVSYMGVDSGIFMPSKVKKDTDILFVGAYQPVDGYDLLKKSLPLMKIKPKVKVLASEKEWITDDKDMRNLYCSSKIIVALAYNEPFGLIPLEAMSCGVPIVAVNEGGYKETVVDGETGCLVPRNPKILARKLDWMLSNGDILEEMGKNARQHIVDKWRWEDQTRILEKIMFRTSSKNE